LIYLPLTTVKRLQKARNKAHILQMAESMGIPVPKTWYINRLSQLDDLKKVLPYPVVIKPRDSSGALGIGYPDNPKELLQQYLIIHRRFPFPLIQERIPRKGTGYGASFLFDENTRVKASFVHKRLREYPVTGGASTLRVSVRHDEIRDMGCALLKSLGWFGVAMVEFKVDPRDGAPKLMEINPRFWGSLSLAIHSGVNFPHLLFKMAARERFDPVDTYRLGVKCRWLLPGDILHFLTNPDRRRIVSQFFRFRRPDTYYDIVSLKDPLPALIRILTPLTFLYDGDMQMRLRKRRIAA
jgi:predicted ATP-grasp superfamily ATP-dependent carboligase